MAIPEKMTGALSENLLTLLSHSDEHGRLIANVLDPQLFEGEMRIMAERIIDYWRQEHQAPKLHTADLFADILEDPRNRRAATYRRTLHAMLQLGQGINAQYVLGQLKTFVRMQKLKDAILRSAEILNRPAETTISDVEAILGDILRARDFLYQPGLQLESFDILIEHLRKHHSEFLTGIPAFDRLNICPARGTLFLLLGGAGVGKTWGMVYLGKRAMLDQKKVLHVTPELSAEDTLLRYYMALWAAAKRPERFDADEHERIMSTMLELDRDGRLSGLYRESVDPEFDFDSLALREELQTRVINEGPRLGELRIFRVAPRALSVDGLIGYLDTLEDAEGFVPDELIVDAAYLLKPEGGQKEYRHALGRTIERLRGIGVDRNMAVVASHQLSKIGFEAKRAKHTHVAEDWSIIQTADIAVTMSATPHEQRFGLARLYADKVRADKGDVGVLITQNLDIGQYLLDSHRLSNSYWDTLSREFPDPDREREQNDTDDDDDDGTA
jgi:hypothetical protein